MQRIDQLCHNPFPSIRTYVDFYKKMGQPRPLFRLFKQTLQFSLQIKVKKCPSSIWHQDSNSQPSDNESPPLTTRPGLLPTKVKLESFVKWRKNYSVLTNQRGGIYKARILYQFFPISKQAPNPLVSAEC